jgi:hypothetical protein
MIVRRIIFEKKLNCMLRFAHSFKNNADAIIVISVVRFLPTNDCLG